jgi:hypothetical protein
MEYARQRGHHISEQTLSTAPEPTIDQYSRIGIRLDRIHRRDHRGATLRLSRRPSVHLSVLLRAAKLRTE